MIFVYTDHARTRRRQRGITELEVEHVLLQPSRVIQSFDRTHLALDFVNNRAISVKIAKTENYMLVITVM
jgi:hypothetical protein